MALAVALYAFDSCLLLYSNEGVLVADSSGKWNAVLGSDDFTLAGRSVYVANLLVPYRAVFRLAWRLDGSETDTGSTDWSDLPPKLSAVAPFSAAAGFALYVLLPLGLFTRLGRPLIASAVALTYLSNILALWSLFPHRESAQLSVGRFAELTFECIACPPFGVNLARRVALAQKITEPLPRAAHRLLDDEAWSDFKLMLVTKIDDELNVEPTDSPRAKALKAQSERLRCSGVQP